MNNTKKETIEQLEYIENFITEKQIMYMKKALKKGVAKDEKNNILIQ